MQTKQSIITLVGAAILLLFALTLISFVPRTPTIEAQAPSLQGQNEPTVAIEFNTWNSKEEYGTSIQARLTFTNFQDITTATRMMGASNIQCSTIRVTYQASTVHERVLLTADA